MYTFDPAGFCSLDWELARLDLEVEGLLSWAAGRSIEGRAGCGVGVPPGTAVVGAAEYEVVVDAERGVLLRCASWLGGEGFDALEVDEIFFDEQFPEEVFTSREPLPWR